MSFYSATTVTARKEHKCGDCGRKIEPGTQYERTAGAAYGDFWTWKNCLHCKAYRAVVRAIDEDSYYDEDGFSLSDWHLNYGTAPEIAHMVKDPIKALAYYRIARWFEARWRDRDGQLREIPVLP